MVSPDSAHPQASWQSALYAQCQQSSHSPLYRIEDIVSLLRNAKVFSNMDLANVYLHLPLEKEAKEYIIISTNRDLYRYNRLSFGVSSAPAIFQCTMDSLLVGISNVSVYINDLLVSGSTEEEHL